jgi:DNA-binding transcriptional MerR regulator
VTEADQADRLTINEAAQSTGWSARMLRYIEHMGLVEPARTAAGYRLYGAPELQRLRTLRELLSGFELELSEVGFAARLRREPGLREAVDGWLEAQPVRPSDVPVAEWLRFEQNKHERLLAAVNPEHRARIEQEGAEGANDHQSADLLKPRAKTNKEAA